LRRAGEAGKPASYGLWSGVVVMRTFTILGILVVVGCMLLPAQGPPPPIRPLPGGSYLGIGIQEINADRAKALKLPPGAVVEITRVGTGSPADKAGLKTGDVVLQYNGVRVEGIEHFSRIVRDTPVGRDVKLEILRNGAAQTVSAKIGQHPAPQVFPFPDGFGLPLPDGPRIFEGWRSPMLGVEAESLDGQLAQYFGVSQGVLVRAVMKGSPAEKGGIKAGDVILRIEDGKVATPADISGRLRALGGKSVPVALMRDHKEMTVNVAVESEESLRRRNSGSPGANPPFNVQQQ
jgi:serine protease Do